MDHQYKKRFSLEGGFSTLTPESNSDKYKNYTSPISACLQTLEAIPDQNAYSAFKYNSCINTASRSRNSYIRNKHLRNFSGGKGRNHSNAKAGALCEAIERFSCAYQGGEEVINASYEELGDKAIHPHSCLNFSEKQYEMKDQLNASCDKYYFMIPQEFDENEKIDWSKVMRPGSDDFKYIPANYCYFKYPVEDKNKCFCFPDSNGNAAANTMEEAILQGLLELIGIDSVAIWWLNMLKCPEVDISSFNHIYFDKMCKYYKSINRSLYALDLTFDLEIPCFAVISCDSEGKKPLIGFGAHTDARRALEKALIELNQFLPALHDQRYSKDVILFNWLDTATSDNQQYLVPLEGAKKTCGDYLNISKPSAIDSIKYCQDRLRQEGMEVYYLDMTRPDISLPVVKVIVPGLRTFWKRLGPGRLYDVPVKLNILNKKKREEELNPISLFL